MTNHSQHAGNGFTEGHAAQAGRHAVQNFTVRGDEPLDQIRTDIRNMLHSALVASLEVLIQVGKDHASDIYDSVSVILPLSKTLHASYQSATDVTRMSKALMEDAQQADDSVRAGITRQMAFEWAIAALECYASTAAHYLELMERHTVCLRENGVVTTRNRPDVFAVVRQLHSAMMNAAKVDLQRQCDQRA